MSEQPPLNPEQSSGGFLGDDPILTAAEDQFDRSGLSGALAREIAELDASRGAVVAITGSWGSGKTSLMNLTAERLRADEGVLGVVEFNPWLFSGSEQLTGSLLTELASQLDGYASGLDKVRSGSAELVGKLKTYSQGFSILGAVPLVGKYVDGVQKGLEGFHDLLQGDQSLQARRQEAVEALQGIEQRIVVLIDDIDRLTRSETRDLFRAVRLSASFPNVVYLLCLDQEVVARALDEEGFSGKAYLEKILTVTCRVPELSDHQVEEMFMGGLNSILESHQTLPADEAKWAAIYPSLIRPLIRTGRDAKRVLTSLPITLRLVGEQLPIEDVVALETLRVLHPELHGRLAPCNRGLTEPQSQHPRQSDEELIRQVTEFVAGDSQNQGRVAQAAIAQLFPHALARLHPGEPGWQLSTRPDGVGLPRGLDFYLTMQLAPGQTPNGTIRSLAAVFGDRDALATQFSELDDEYLEDALRQLEPAAQAIDPDHVGATVAAFLELLPRIRRERSGLLDFGGKYLVRRPVLQMLRRIEQEDEREAIVTELVNGASTSGVAFELLTIVGHGRNADQRLISEKLAAELKAELRERLFSAGEELAQEPALTEMLFHSFRITAGEPVVSALVEHPAVAAAAFNSALSQSYSTTIGAGPSIERVNYGLHWEILLHVFGEQSHLESAVKAVEDAGLAIEGSVTERAVGLVHEYLGGGRPSDVDD